MVIGMKKRLIAALLAGMMLVQTTACGNSTSGTVGTVDNTETMSESGTEADTEKEGDEVTALSLMQQVNTAEENVIDDNYRTYYEVFVYSFYDSDGDGIGDLKGLTENLDYINDGDPETDTDLGCNGIWLMPIMPSTTYHKYDVTDYEAIDPEYGTMDDFTTLVDECHKRGINVIIDFVMNHTSSQHEWFQTAYKYIQSLPEGAEPDASECPYVDYYNFSKEKLGGYYPVEGTDWYYEGQFWSEMPDLNWDNEMLKTEFEQIVQFWLNLGVDGFRLDAVKEFYSGADDKNIAVLTWFNDMVKSKKEDAYLVGEAWNDYSVYAKYYQSGMDSFFDFTFADKDGIIADTVKGINGASAYGKGLVNTQELYGSYSDTYIDAPFYTNHDMARSAGYYSGDHSEAQTKLGNAMNLLMSGSAFLYYGEELGMKGSGKDENKRAPMYWSTDADATGMCDGPKDMDEVKMKYGSLKEQENDGNSIYNFVNTSEKAQTVDFGKSALGATEDRKYPLQIAGELLTGTEAAVLDEEQLTIPAYSVVILE